jgi:serine/threonine-protein kinase
MSEDERTAMLAASATGTTRRVSGRHGPPTSGGPATEYGYYDDEPPRSTGRIVGITVAVLAVLGIVGFGLYQFLGPTPAAPKVPVPAALVGQTEQAARAQLTAAGLRVGEVVRVASTVEEADKVTATDPPVGTQVDERTLVKLSIGAGPAEVTVPRLIGGTAETADAELKAVGLVLGTTTERETPDAGQVGKIVETTPQPGEKVAGGTRVDVVVGKKPTSISIPDLRGEDLQEAANQLAGLGLEVNPEARQVDGSGEENSVAGTDPAAGTKVQPGTRVTLLASRGNRDDVPDVVGLQPAQAEEELREAGFEDIGVEVEQVDDPAQENRVIEQSIDAGKPVDPDDKITITFGNFPGGVNG